MDPSKQESTCNTALPIDTIAHRQFVRQYWDFFRMIGFYLAGEPDWREIAYKEIPFRLTEEQPASFRVVKFLSILLKTRKDMKSPVLLDFLTNTNYKLANKWWLIGLDDDTTLMAVRAILMMWALLETKSHPNYIFREGMNNAQKKNQCYVDTFKACFMETFFEYECAPTLIAGE